MAGPESRPGVLVVGSANFDIVVRVPRLPRPGETVLGGPRREFRGGKGANQALAAARAAGGAHRVRLVCFTGEDAAGASYRKFLAAEGIERGGLLRARGPTGTALILVDGEGKNQIAVSPGANALLTPGRLGARRDLLDWGAAVLAQLEVPLSVVREAFRRGRRRGAVTILNPAPAPSSFPAGLLALTDVLAPNEAEAARLLGRKPAPRPRELPGLARDLLSLGPRAVVITAGARGAFFLGGDEGGWAEPPPGIRAVDTTGAGDAFCGALALALAEGAGLAGAVRLAVAASSLSVRREGAQEGLPGRREILRARRRVRTRRLGARN
ncbi:MAG: ribokinase [Candidatus Tectomicrobia bacterium]|uniref:Ribokinase n=1 Tax=Tectimicrobiota bacterium TaxID=2528274 RepID=A0A932HVZ1_UNCTE|nr:ribokinase [Candidatus Tectomicrobia bacterium]